MKPKNDRRLIINILIIGFAMFSGFFGAGNLIFPPFLARSAGNKWMISFLCFVLADGGLGMLTVMASLQSSGSVRKLLGQLGPFSSALLCSLLILCTGPLVVVPRTCATTFELGISPMFPSLSPWLFSAIFFLIVGLMTIRPSRVVDIVGRYLTPILLATLAVLCLKGIFDPLGQPGAPREGFRAVREGILAGYQTMDTLAAYSDRKAYRMLQDLQEDGRIMKVGRGHYSNTFVKSPYHFNASSLMDELVSLIDKEYPLITYQTWELYQWNEFVNHQLAHNAYFIEVESGLETTVFDMLLEKYPRVLLDPGMEEYYRYRADDMIIVQKLISGAPAPQPGSKQASLEKLLVDIFSRKLTGQLIERAEYRQTLCRKASS